jgi:hypothetical protein
MIIKSVEPDGYLYSVTDCFSTNILEQILNTDWLSLPYNRLSIGSGRRRHIHNQCLHFAESVNQSISQDRALIQTQCNIVFTPGQYFGVDWWVDEPGFKPQLHCDGDLPTALQIYFLPIDNPTLGTTFFNSQSANDILHRFLSESNTGYLMFNSHTCNGVRKLLWHDMERPVPENNYRVCCYITLGTYTKHS